MLATLLILIFTRPFISSLAFPEIDFFFSVLLLSLLALWVITRRVRFTEIPALRWPLALFVLAMLISVCFSGYPLNSLVESIKYLAGLLIFTFGFSLRPEEKKKILLVMGLCALFISGLAIYQYAFGFKHLLDYVSTNNITDPFILESIRHRRAFFPFVTAGVLGGYLAMVFPLTLNNRKKIFFAAPILAALLLTKSLSALLSLFVGILVYFYFEGKLEKKRIFLISGLWALIALVLVARFTAQKEHLQPAFSTAMRLNYWADTFQIIKASPLAGVGLGNFNLTHSRYAHNAYLQIWAEMGILGLVSFLWLIALIFKEGFRNLKIPEERKTTIGLMAASAVFLFHNLADFTFFLPEISMLWWGIAGLMLSKNKDHELPDHHPSL